MSSTADNGYGSIKIGNDCEVYGKLKLVDYGVIAFNSNKALTMMTGSQLQVAGSKNVVIPTGSQLKFKGGSRASTTATTEIVVESGATLFAGTTSNEDIEINGTVRVKSGGTLDITSDCILRIDNFIIESGGTLMVRAGSRLILNQDREYVCAGTFNATGGSASSDHIYVTARESCPVPAGNGDVIGTATLKIQGVVTGGGTGVIPAYFTTTYTDFENVVVKLIDASKGAIRSNFNANNAIAVAGGGAVTYVLNLENTLVSAGPSNMWHYYLQSCNFSGPSDPYKRQNTGGLYVTNHETALTNYLENIENSTFSSFKNCIFAETCNGLRIKGTTVGNCDIGIKTITVYPTICTSTISGNQAGMSLTLDGLYAYNNVVGPSTVGVLDEGGIDGHFRSNQIYNYSLAGIVSDGVDLWLTNHFTGSQYEALGRNQFYFVGTPPSTTTSDILLGAGFSYLNVACGYNSFNPSSTYHVSLDMLASYSIPGSYNDWQSSATPRSTSNLGIGGTNFNSSLTGGVQCTSAMVSSACYTGVIGSETHEKGAHTSTLDPAGDSYTDQTDWWLRSSLEDSIQAEFNVQISTILSKESSPKSQKDALHVAFSLARLTDTSGVSLTRMTSLDSALSIAMKDGTLSDSVRALGLYQASRIRACLGALGDAKSHLESIFSSFPQSKDSIPAAWQKQLIEVSDAGEAGSGARDSALAEYHYRVLNDVNLKIHALEGARESVARVELKPGFTITPNPASTDVTVGFETLSNLPTTIEVYDLLGRLISSKAYAGGTERNSLSLDISTINNGYYILRVTQAGRVIASKRFEILR